MKKILNKYTIVGLVIIITFCIWQNNDIIITNINVSNKKIPKSFNEYKIVQISDLHNKKFGNKQKKLVNKTREAEPDIIVITGDLIDRNNLEIDSAMDYINAAIEIAPIYYVSGNHEIGSGSYRELCDRLIEVGVIVLDNKECIVKKNDDNINLIGLADPTLNKKKDIVCEKEKYNIVLSHRPELFSEYVKAKVDLAFTGHAHGGQVRIPFIGGLIAPNQGLLPKYTSGLYSEANTSMVVSRGLGNSVIPVRILNRPEIVVVTLINKD